MAIDLILRRRSASGRLALLLAPLLGAAFLAVFLVTQWYSSIFLISDLADNRFFANNHWGYGERIGEWATRFWGLETDPLTAGKLGFAFVLATLSSGLGLGWGAWMRRVRR